MDGQEKLSRKGEKRDGGIVYPESGAVA